MLKTPIKWILSAILLAVIIAGASFWWAAREQPASHPVLAETSLPPLIPLREFYANTSSEWGYSLSPEGKRLAWRAVRGASAVLRYRHLEGGPVHEIAPNGNFEYAMDDAHDAFYVSDQNGLWIIDAESPDETWKRISTAGLARARLARFPTADDPHWYFAGFDRSQAAPDLVRYDRQGGDFTVVARNDGSILDWVLSPKGEFMLRYRRMADGGTGVEIWRDEEWDELLSIGKGDTFIVVSKPKPGKPFFALSNRGRDKIAAVSVAPDTGAESIVYENEEVDVASFGVDEATNEPAYAVVADPYTRVVAFDSKEQAFQKLISTETRKASKFSQAPRTENSSRSPFRRTRIPTAITWSISKLRPETSLGRARSHNMTAISPRQRPSPSRRATG